MEKNIKRITVEYDDGTIGELEKGLVVRINEHPSDGVRQITVDMQNLVPTELGSVVEAIVYVGSKIGAFEDLEVGSDD